MALPGWTSADVLIFAQNALDPAAVEDRKSYIPSMGPSSNSQKVGTWPSSDSDPEPKKEGPPA